MTKWLKPTSHLKEAAVAFYIKGSAHGNALSIFMKGEFKEGIFVQKAIKILEFKKKFYLIMMFQNVINVRNWTIVVHYPPLD